MINYYQKIYNLLTEGYTAKGKRLHNTIKRKTAPVNGHSRGIDVNLMKHAARTQFRAKSRQDRVHQKNKAYFDDKDKKLPGGPLNNLR